jgi:multidrug efflux pump
LNTLIDAAIARTRPVLLVLVLILVAGSVAYLTMPKEADPDVPIPFVYVSMTHEGISPEDAERLLVRPMEKELRAIEGLKELTATAAEGYASVTLEFEAGFDSDRALNDVREKVDIAKVELPADTDEPLVDEVNVALFPVLVVTLSGEAPERTLVTLARDLRDKLEGLAGVLEVDIAGDREDLLEVLIDPVRLESYNQSPAEMLEIVTRNNQLVAAGTLDSGQGRFAVKVPGVIETLDDVLTLPLKVSDGKVVTFRDVATVRRTFKDPDGFARVNGRPAVTLEISKRIGANIIDTLAQVRTLVETEQAEWPDTIQVSYSQDKSEDIRIMLKDLQNNVIAAVLLVMIVVMAALGVRSAGLVGVAIPGSFLAGILVLSMAGLTLNIVVLFALIMAVGMLVDGAIVVVELADRKMAEGLHRREAFGVAAKRMAWPIIAATATTLAAFLPLLFWPGMMGEFMKYLPMTLIATLTASLFMALIFVPALGALVGGRSGDVKNNYETLEDFRFGCTQGSRGEAHGMYMQYMSTPSPKANDVYGQMGNALAVAEDGDLSRIKGLTGSYIKVLDWALINPVKVTLGAILLLIGVYIFYGQVGKGIEFFPDVEPENAIVEIRARGDLSVVERDQLVREVESRVLDMAEFTTIYARSGTQFQDDLPEDVIGLLQLELTDWQQRRPAKEILAEVRQRVADLAGIVIETRKEEAGPSEGKPVQVQLSSRRPELLPDAIAQVREGMRSLGGFVDVTDSRPIPGIEWQIQVDRAEAGRYGADIATVGNAIQLVTTGIKVGEYRPNDSDDEVDIRVRFPVTNRSIEDIDRLRVPSTNGTIPVDNFVKRVAKPRVGTLERSSSQRVLRVQADVAEGLLLDAKVQELRRWISNADLDPRVEVTFKGEDEDQREAQAFLTKAFGIALFLMAIILVTQFNSFYQALLILSAVGFSTIGVLLGLLITQQPFGVVMSGVGVIALAGIVVNNNIVLIDTFNQLKVKGLDTHEAVLRTGAQRLRPVLLTTITTILGLLPMVLGVNIDLINRAITVGAPSSQWWTQLSTAVAGGLAFATLLTLVLTPCLLMLGERQFWQQKWAVIPVLNRVRSA